MDGRERLAELFGAWVDQNGWSQPTVAAMGGPSTTTQTKIRRTTEPLSASTLRQLDVVMGWDEGTAARVQSGVQESPTPRSRRKAAANYRQDGDGLLDLSNGRSPGFVSRLGDRDESLLGWHKMTHPDGHTTQITIRFNFGGPDFLIPESEFLRILEAAHRAAVGATLQTERLEEPTPEEIEQYLATHRAEPDANFEPDHGSLARIRRAADAESASEVEVARSAPQDNPHTLPTAARRRRGQRALRTDV